MTISLGGITFTVPIVLTSWFPQDIEGVYAILVRNSAGFTPIYFGESENLQERGIDDTHHAYNCWLREGGSVENIFISFHLMPNSSENNRREVEGRLISQYNPICNEQ